MVHKYITSDMQKVVVVALDSTAFGNSTIALQCLKMVMVGCVVNYSHNGNYHLTLDLVQIPGLVLHRSH